MNSYLKPKGKSKWVKIDLIMMPKLFLKQLLLDVSLNKPFSAREVCCSHKLPTRFMTAM